MPWLVGIDEAGYGPNLGPLVLSSVAVQVPTDGAPLAERLRPAIRRACEEDDGRLLLDDSKQVYAARNGLAKLERGVLSVLAAHAASTTWSLADYLHHFAVGTSGADLAAEHWYDGHEKLPVAIDQDDWLLHSGRLAEACDGAGVAWGPARTVVMTPPRFNALLGTWCNKAAVEATAVTTLLQQTLTLPGDDPVLIAVDRLGGRTHYAAIIQTAFCDGWVQTLTERADGCRYAVLGLERELHLYFAPRAETEHLTVAVASMACKYLREVCMRQFNRYWQARVPGLEPTAGYPGDAARYFSQIDGAVRQLGLCADQVWRRK
jgi:hypothetical protein